MIMRHLDISGYKYTHNLSVGYDEFINNGQAEFNFKGYALDVVEHIQSESDPIVRLVAMYEGSYVIWYDLLLEDNYIDEVNNLLVTIDDMIARHPAAQC
jgi:hypothetical protein